MRILLSLAIMALSVVSFAQMPKKQSATIKTPTVQCEECKKAIEAKLPSLDGIIKVNVNYRAKTTTVQWYPDRTNIEEIKTAISNIGYDADDVQAAPDMYKRLPTCCKKPEDGGGHKKG